ncbi:MAG: hypothetical protein U9Q81_13095 [Pseudomonadota bacterium]|nr:hypothetical protein [Pseudomonadota bacterium]
MKRILTCGAVVWCLGIPTANADATLVYELNGPGGETMEKKVSIARFFARVDDPAEKDSYLLYQAGKFFPLFRIDESRGTYTRLTPPVEATLHAGQQGKAVGGAATGTGKEKPPLQAKASPEEAPQGSGKEEQPANPASDATSQMAPEAAVAESSPGEPWESPPSDTLERSPAEGATAGAGAGQPPRPTFKPTKKTEKVAGISCRVILELIDGAPALEHCMANKAGLGITERETRTLSRMLVLARSRGFGWLGAATEDEDFVSVRTRDLRDDKTLTLKSLSTDPLPAGYLRVPRTFKEVKPASGDDAGKEKAPAAAKE